ncbi:MAG TPA: M20/M25/M40 family metallo-hydrolase [archaeon]|nr:M20/M25/M40 family metallo-hydrolase [archaeon]
MDYLLKTLAKLVSFDTNSSLKSNYRECADFIAKEGSKLGMKGSVIIFRGKDKKPRPNVLLEFDAGAKETALILTHFDVVPAGEGWRGNAFKMQKRGSRFFGRGVCDDKGPIAAFLAAFKEVKSSEKNFSCNVKFLCVCDEEVGGEEGIGLLVKKRPKLLKADFCATLDGDLDSFYIGCSGIVRGTITIRGRGGHSGYDFKTENVLHKSIGFMNALCEFKKIRERKISKLNASKNPVSKKVFGRFNITIVNSGHQFNIIPSEVKIGFDMRLLPEERAKKAISEFKSFAKKCAKKFLVRPEFDLKSTEGYFVAKNPYTNKVLQAAQKASSKKLIPAAQLGATDSRYIHSLGIPAFTYTPGGSGEHSNKESISLRELKITKEFVKNLLKN